MKKTMFVTAVFFVICIKAYSLDVGAYSPVEYADFIKFFKSTKEEAPGMKIYGNTNLRVRAILHEFPKEIDETDINNIRSTLRSLGFPPDRASEFGYKVEFVYPSDVEWQKETRLVFYIQKVQRVYFEREYKLNDPIYWFIVFSTFNTFTQRGYFLVSDFMNEAQFKRLNQ